MAVPATAHATTSRSRTGAHMVTQSTTRRSHDGVFTDALTIAWSGLRIRATEVRATENTEQHRSSSHRKTQHNTEVRATEKHRTTQKYGPQKNTENTEVPGHRKTQHNTEV